MCYPDEKQSASYVQPSKRVFDFHRVDGSDTFYLQLVHESKYRVKKGVTSLILILNDTDVFIY